MKTVKFLFHHAFSFTPATDAALTSLSQPLATHSMPPACAMTGSGSLPFCVHSRNTMISF